MSNRTPKGVVDDLAAQVDLLAVLQNNHATLASETADPKIEHLHNEIIDLIEQIHVIYNTLLNEYNRNPG